MSTSNMLGDLFNKQANAPETAAPENKPDSQNLLQGLFSSTPAANTTKEAPALPQPNENLLTGVFNALPETPAENPNKTSNLLTGIFDKSQESIVTNPERTFLECSGTFARSPFVEIVER